jgi:hypothetical protein
MTLIEDVRKLGDKCRFMDSRQDTMEGKLNSLDQTVNDPERGLSVEIKTLAQEIQSFRKAAYWVVGVVLAAIVGWAFSVLVYLA